MATKKNPAAQALGRLGGQKQSAAQRAAQATNLQHLGRPGRACVFCYQPVRGGHRDKRLDETCGQHGWYVQQPGQPTPPPPPSAALARQLLTLHTLPYNNEEADQRNMEFEQLALELARLTLT